jgi:hypothetical protein
MSEIEDLVRAAMDEKVRLPPPMISPGDRAIDRARNRQRRNAATTTLVSILVLALAVGALTALRGSRSTMPGTPTTPPVSTPTPPFSVTSTVRPDLLIDDSDTGGFRNLFTADGHTISLAALPGGADRAYRAPAGWLLYGHVSTGPAGTPPFSLWLVTRDGPAHQLIDRADSVAVAPDGVRIAWRAGDRLIVGHLAGATLTQDQSTPAPPRGAPIAYTGTAVILGYTETGGSLDHIDTWIPSHGDYSPSWDTTLVIQAIYQPGPDGTLYGLVQANSATGGGLCLAQLDPTHNLAATRKACGLTLGMTAVISPDLRWMAKTGFTQQGRPNVELVDLNRSPDTPAVTATWNEYAPVTWIDATALVLLDQNFGLSLAHIGHTALTPITVAGQSTIRAVESIGG